MLDIENQPLLSKDIYDPALVHASETSGMSLAERIAHVGGRENAAGYIEFGSPMAVDALIRQVLRDLPAPTDEMVNAYLAAQRAAVEDADKFGRPNAGGLHTNTVREACRAGLTAALRSRSFGHA